MQKLQYWIPAMPKQINGSKGDKGGQIYIDDFEGTRAGIDLRFPLISWTLASIPQGIMAWWLLLYFLNLH